MGKEGLRGFIWVVFCVIMFAQIVGTFSTEGIAPLATFYLEELSLSRAQVGALTAAIFLGMGALSLVSGRLVDSFGVRRVLPLGLLAIAVSAVLFSVARVFSAAWAFVLLGGLGYSVDQPSTVKAVVTWFPKKIRATMVGIKQAGVSLGQVMAALVLVPLANLYGWRSSMVFAGLIALLAAALVFFIYREADESRQEAENGARISPLRVLAGSRNLKLLLISGPIRMAANYSLVTYLVLYLVEARSFAPTIAASFLALSTISSALSRVIWGMLSDALGGRRKLILTLVSLCGVAGAMVFVFLPARPVPVLIGAGSILLGAGLSGGAGILSVMMAEASGGQSIGAMIGMSGTVSCLGIVIGPPIFGWIVDRTGNYQPAWAMMAIFTLVALVISICLEEERDEQHRRHREPEPGYLPQRPGRERQSEGGDSGIARPLPE